MSHFKNHLENTAKRLCYALGLEVSWLRKGASPLVHHKIELLFDIGANIGQYAQRARVEGYRGQIVSVEPLSSAHATLVKAARHDPLWSVHERCALGAQIGETTIHVAGNSQSSSILAMLPLHAAVAPDSHYVSEEVTKTVTLDSLVEIYRKREERLFVKIDTQGYEKEVLDGAKECLPHISGLQIELSLAPLYESQHLYRYFLERLEEVGFRIWSLQPGFSDARTGQMLQVDAIFVR